MRISLPLLLASLLFTACVGGSLRNHEELENFPIRDATKDEGHELKRCLKAAHYYMELRKQKTGKPYARAAEIPSKKYCPDFKLSLGEAESGGYEITAAFSDGDNTVRWSINENAVIEEHLPETPDADLEF